MALATSGCVAREIVINIDKMALAASGCVARDSHKHRQDGFGCLWVCS